MAEFIRPFGPTIYISKFKKDEILFLQDIARTTRQARNNVGKHLVGNIKDQLSCFFKSKKEEDKFYSILDPYIIEYLTYEHNRRTGDDGPDLKKVSYDLRDRPWINFQEAGEFNPIHSHTGKVSSVVYIDVPEEIHQEKITNDSGFPKAPGQIDFVHGPDALGSWGTWSSPVATGDILLFHAGLKHTVYPFKSNVTRISMSFNIDEFTLHIDEET